MIGFLHSCTLAPGATRILDYLVEYLGRQSLPGRLDRLFVVNVGARVDEDRFSDVSDRIVVFNASADVTAWENLTIRHLAFFSRLHPDEKILYLHTKGVSHPETHPYYDNIRDWVDFMLYCLVDHAHSCVEMLDHVDVVGCDYRHLLFDGNPSHFSGNFWWATARYLATLPVDDLSARHDAEFWLFRNRPAFVHIHKCPVGHYENPYKREQYADVVSRRIGHVLSNLRNADGVRILYGVEGRYLDVTETCRRELRHGDVVRIPAGDAPRNAVFSDPLPGVVKHVRIGELTYPYTEDVCFRLSR